MLDEFQQLGKLPGIVRAYRLLAGYNFIVWIFAQDWAGLTELYGNEANTFLSSSRAVQIFSLTDAVSRADFEADWHAFEEWYQRRSSSGYRAQGPPH